ncbi:alpha/beta fold hydrolase [Rubrobacter tropicus]|uniref:Alpha/beta fold hydrolase n=1 Tax=Rubrobacter tropicus TaxID=2653851 RepID=A0A6G8QDU1_9ACTN|nr:alpha/beta hydrolase [Rubrobacter tropicus]QIN84674.1 alpha/beta fold hydrolase [Rubrobacter tropicus]
MNQSRTGTLKVPGATLYYEVRGAGPVLLMIPGGPADAGGFAPIRDILSDRYTVVTYDPRGLSRSPLDGDALDVTVRTFADDAHRLLASFGTGPACVLGDSGGALVGIELAVRHPEQVRALVAHEPPLTRLLEDADEHARFAREVYDTYLAEGTGPAMQKFLASAGLPLDPPEAPGGPTPEMAEAMARMQGNMDYFLGHMWLPLGDYAPDIHRLRTRQIAVAVGEASEGQLAHRAALALAGRLGKRPAVLPGGHSGIGSQPEVFAWRLHEILASTGAPEEGTPF